MALYNPTLAAEVTSTAQRVLQVTLAHIAATIPQSVLAQPAVETVVTFCTPWADALEAMPADPRNT